jgi:catechol 2,3-dioxygenase-like lactoylglutathione lyase family enzyme
VSAASGIRYLELGSSDLDRSAKFYAGLLGLPEVTAPSPGSRPSRWFDAGPAMVKVVHVDDGDPGDWRDDDLQGGIRHAGFKTADVDALIRRLEAAGTTILAPPRDVLGDVRIAFFLDPDGARLELVQGALSYQRVASPHLVHGEATGLPEPGSPPRFDHVGVTASDLSATTAYWRAVGYEPIGDIRHHDDPRGFLMTYWAAGGSALEVFSFDVPTAPPPAWGEHRLGLRGIGVALPDESVAAHAPDGVHVRAAS